MFERRRTIQAIPAALGFVMLLGLLDPTRAHDYWLAQEGAASPGKVPFVVKLLVGDALEPELERPLQKDMTTRYEWMSSTASVDLLPVMADSAMPVLSRRIEAPGSYLLVMDRKFVDTESTAEQFVAFAEHEALVDVAAIYKAKPNDAKVRRRYARNLKALVQAGSAPGTLGQRVVGQALEILLLEDPRLLESGDSLRVQVLLQGEALENQSVRALVQPMDGAVSIVESRTDAAGIAAFAAAHPGFWVIRVSHSQPCDRCADADWITRYATFSFVMP